MANEYKSSIRLGVTLKPTSEIQNELNNAIKQLEKNSNIDLKIDTKSINQSLKDFGNTLNDISNKIKSDFNFQGVFSTQASGINNVTSKLKEERQAIEQTSNAMKTLSNIKIAILNDDGSVKETLKDITKLQDGISKTITLTNDLKNNKITSSTTDNSGKQQIDDTKAMYKQMFDEIDATEKASIKDKTQMYSQMFDTLETRQKEYSKLFDQANAKELQDIKKIENANQNTQINRNNSDKNNELAQARAINKALEEQYQEALKLEKVKDTMQGKLNTASNNQFINESVISELQNRLNSINTNTAEKEIKELQQTINNLSSSDSQIVRLQNTISKMENNLTNMRGKYGSLVGDSSSKAQLEAYTLQIEKLKSTLSSLQSGGVISGQKLSSELNKGTQASRELSTAVKNSSNALKLATTDSETFGQSIKRALQNTGLYMGTYQAVQMLTNAFKDATTYIIQLDTAMTNLKKVTNETNETYSNFLNQAHDIAMEYGSQSDKVVDATTSWAKTGESLKNATELAKSTMLLTKVGDIENIATAQQYMIAPLKAFNIEADKSITLIDKYNNISNNMATSTNDLGEALSKSASSMSTAGNTLEQTLALIATAESQTKLGGDVVGQGFKTISLRIATFKDENGEVIPSFEKQLSKLGITMRDTTTGQILPTFDILQQVGEKFKILDTNTKLQISQLLGGKLQANIVSSVLNNVDELNRAYQLSTNSAGSAMNEFKTYQQGIQYSIDQLKESISNMYKESMNSSTLKSLIDILTKLINTFGNIPTIVGLATTAFLLFKGQAIVGLISNFSAMITSILAYESALAGTTITLGSVTGATTLLSYAMNTLKLAFIENPFGLIAIAITGAVVAMDLFGNSEDKVKQKNEELLSTMQQLKSDITSLTDLQTKFTSLSGELESGNLSTDEATKKKQELSDVYKQLIQQAPELEGLLDNESSSYDEQAIAIQNVIKLKQDELGLKAKEYFSKNDINDNSIKDQIDKLNGLKEDLKEQSKELTMPKAEFQDANFINPYLDLFGEETNNAMARLKENNEKTKKEVLEIEKSWQTMIANHNIEKQLGIGTSVSDESIAQMQKIISETNLFGEKTQKATNQVTLMQNAMKELNGESGKISDKTLKSLSEAFPDLKFSSDDASGAVKKFSKELKDNSNVITDAKKELSGLKDGGSLSTETINKLASAFPELKINASNAKDVLGKLPDVEKQIADDAKKAQEEMQKLADKFSKFGDEAKMIDTIKEEMAKYNGISEDTLGTIISKYPDLLKVMSQEGDLTENLTKKQTELRAEQEQEKQKAIAKANEVANAEIKADSDSTTSNNDANETKIANDTTYTETAKANSTDTSNTQKQNDTDSANNHATATGTKSENDANYNNTVRENASGTTTEQNNQYQADNSNNDKANQEKIAQNQTFTTKLGLMIWDLVSGNNKAYEADVDNFTDSIKKKYSWLSWLADGANKLLGGTGGNNSENSIGDVGTGEDDLQAYLDEQDKKQKDKKVEEKAKVTIPQTVNPYVPQTITTASAKAMDEAQKKAEDAQKKAEQTAKEIADMKVDIEPDRYAFEQGNIKDAENALRENKTLQDSLVEGSQEFVNAQNQQIDILKQKKNALMELNMSYEIEKGELKDKLSQNGFLFDSEGKLLNAKQQMLALKEQANSMGGNTDEDKKAKQDAIDSVKKLNEETKRYNDLQEDYMPKNISDWKDLGNEIDAVNKKIQETAESQIISLGTDLMGGIKEKLEKQQTQDLNNITKRKKIVMNDLQNQIDDKKKELDSLNDDSSDKQTKLNEYKTQLAMWQKDGSAISIKNQNDLQTKITDLEKEIQKDSIQKDLDTLDAKKTAKEKYYDDQEQATKDQYTKDLDEQKIYNQASKLLQSGNTEKMLEILKAKKPDFTSLWKDLGKSSADAYSEEVKKGLEGLNVLKYGTNSDQATGKVSTSTTVDHTSKYVEVGDDMKIANLSGEVITGLSNGMATSSNGTWKDYVSSSDKLKAIEYDNGYFKVAKNGKDIGWARREDIALYDTGGRTPSDIPNEGKLGILHKEEKILNSDDTIKFDNAIDKINNLDEIYSFIKDSGSLITQLSQSYTNLSGYVAPSIASMDLNKINSSIINNNSNTNNPVNIKNEFNVTNTSNVQARSSEQNIAKLIAKEAIQYGKRI